MLSQSEERRHLTCACSLLHGRLEGGRICLRLHEPLPVLLPVFAAALPAFNRLLAAFTIHIRKASVLSVLLCTRQLQLGAMVCELHEPAVQVVDPADLADECSRPQVFGDAQVLRL